MFDKETVTGETGTKGSEDVKREAEYFCLNCKTYEIKLQTCTLKNKIM